MSIEIWALSFLLYFYSVFSWDKKESMRVCISNLKTHWALQNIFSPTAVTAMLLTFPTGRHLIPTAFFICIWIRKCFIIKIQVSLCLIFVHWGGGRSWFQDLHIEHWRSILFFKIFELRIKYSWYMYLIYLLFF